MWPNFGTEIDAKRYDWIRVIRRILAEGYLDAKKGYLQLLTLTTTLKAVRKMANLAPRAFPLKVGGAGKSPGNEVEKWPEIKETT